MIKTLQGSYEKVAWTILNFIRSLLSDYSRDHLPGFWLTALTTDEPLASCLARRGLHWLLRDSRKVTFYIFAWKGTFLNFSS